MYMYPRSWMVIFSLAVGSYLQFPVPLCLQEPKKQLEDISKYSIAAQDKIPSLLEEHHRNKRSESDDGGSEEVMEAGREGKVDSQLSPDAAEAMRKINPLTIANQVSHIFHKNEHHYTGSEDSKPASEEMMNDSCDGNEDGLAEQDTSYSWKELQRPSADQFQNNYEQDKPPKIVSKPRTKDFAYSVIVLAGDPINIPVNRKELKTKQVLQTNRDVEQPGRREEAIAEERIIKDGTLFNKEISVPKHLSKNPSFPVYDMDLSFHPDPYQGILEENYWTDPAHKETNLYLQGVRDEIVPFGVRVKRKQQLDEKERCEDGSRRWKQNNFKESYNGTKVRLSSKSDKNQSWLES